MKALKIIAAGLIVILATAFIWVQSGDWRVKDDYTVKVYRNTQGPIFFKGLKADISFDKAHPEKAKIKATIDSRTIDTGHEEMTAHAKEVSVLDAEKFPEITFESTSVRKTNTGYETTGNFTLKGITKEIAIPFTFEQDTFIGQFTIVANDFNITRNGAVPSGQIRIELKIPVKK